MIIVGCDFHPGWQQVAVFDSSTGEIVECKLVNGNGEAELIGRSRIQTGPCKRRRRQRALENGKDVFHFRTGPAAGCSHRRIMAEVKSRIDGWWNWLVERVVPSEVIRE
jgi:hypothetical protein